MGYFDREPEGWSELADTTWAPPTVIWCNSKWTGQDRHQHSTTREVRECYRAAYDEQAGIQVWPCSWLLEGRYDDGSAYTFECGAPARETADGYACIHGHDYVTPEARLAQGWDYAEDEGAAELLRKQGVQAVAMNGGSV